MSDDQDAAKPYYDRVARHYLSAGNLSEAERYFVKAGEHKKAVEMYTRFNRWDEAHSVAMSYMTESEVGMLYISQAQRMETAGKLKQAEKLYLKVKEPNLFSFYFRIQLVWSFVAMACSRNSRRRTCGAHK
jgi:intraflagellar transport protein 172